MLLKNNFNLLFCAGLYVTCNQTVMSFLLKCYLKHYKKMV